MIMKSDIKTLEAPDGWEKVKLNKDNISVLTGFAFSSSKFTQEKGIPIIRIRDLGKERTEAFYDGDYDELYLIKNGDIIIGMDGEFNIDKWNGPNALLNQRVCKIESKSNDIDNQYLYYVLKKPLKEIEKRIGQTTVKHLSTKDIYKINILKPPIEEQKQIVDVLRTVDDEIQKSNNIINRCEKLKKGLMQHLFNNQNWKSSKLADENYFKLIMGQSPSSKTYNSNHEGLSFYQGNADFGKLHPEPRIYCDSPIKIAEKNDILISIRAPVGELNIANERCCIGRGLSAIRILKGKSLFYYYFLSHIKDKIQYLGQGSTFKAITGREFKQIGIPLPSIEEQEKIISVLSTSDRKTELEYLRKAKLARIKNGLMNDLLTGKKRAGIAK
jgi:type I restriction enzyme, S subunit